MKKVQVTSRGIPSQPRSQYRTGGSTTIMGGGGGTPIDLSAYMLLSRWLENFEERTDVNGVPYLYAKKSIVTVGGLTQYASEIPQVPSIFEGIPFDNKTIWFNTETKVVEVIGGTSGGGGEFDIKQVWAALSATTNEQINHSHLTTALQGYATESWANSNFLGKTDKAVDSDKIDGEHNGNLTSRYWHPTAPVEDLNNYRHNGFAAWSTVSANKPYEYGTLFQFSNQDNPIAGTNDHWVNQLAYGTNNRLYVRQRINNTSSWTSWSSVAYLTDNVASATKLQTTRTIWGQSFDGTKSINGNLTIGSGNSDDKISIYNNSLTDSYCRISNTNTNKTIAFGIGASGINRGMYDISFSKWMIYSDNTKTYLCDNIWINQSAYNNGLYINRTAANLGGAISFYSNNSGLGIIGINGSKTFEFGVLNGTAIDLKFTVDSNGNALARGGITQYSDQRAKTIIEQITLSLKDIAQSPAIRFKWNNWKQKDDGKTHIGGIAQYVQNVLPEAIYNSDDVLTMDYATTGYIFAVNTAKHLLSYETKTDKEIKKLKQRVKYLEKQLKKLGYEEANIMDN